MTAKAKAPAYRDYHPLQRGMSYKDVPPGSLIRTTNDDTKHGIIFYKPHRVPWYRRSLPVVVGAPVGRMTRANTIKEYFVCGRPFESKLEVLNDLPA